MPKERPWRPVSAEMQERIRPESIPHALRPYPQWVCWQYVERGEGKKPDKRPLNPHTLSNAGVTWANTWSSYEQAVATYRTHRERGVSGIGFVLTPDDPFIGIDIDDCMEEGEWSPFAHEVIRMLESYTEISPSGKGLRILVDCPEYDRNARRPEIEVYAHSRFLTLTGDHLSGTPETLSAVDATLIEQLAPLPPSPVVQPSVSTIDESLTDLADPQELWARIFAYDRFGEAHLRRFQGDLSQDGDDHSLTVIRLLNCLACWTGGDAGQMRAMMLKSPLANEKWLSKRGGGDWLDYQIADAIRYVTSQ